MSKNHIPKGCHTVNPYLIIPGAAKLIDFLKQVFDAEELLRMEGPEGMVMHAGLRIGDSMLELSEGNETWKPMPGSLHVYVPDVDATFQRAIKAGAVSMNDVSDKFYGERGGSVRDPFGNVWHIATAIEELSAEELHRRAAEYQA